MTEKPTKPKKLSKSEQAKLEAQELAMRPLVEFAKLAQESGCPQDQVHNLLKAGLILQPKQLKFAAAARHCDLPDGPTAIGFGGARGGGKSFTVLTVVGADDCQRYPGLKVLFLRKVGKSNREQFEDFRKKVFSRLEHEYREQKGVLTFKNGSTIIVGHFKDESGIDNYLGLEYDIIVIEEATTLTFSKWKNILTCMRSSKPGWRPRAYLSTNPGNVGHQWFKELFILPSKEKREKETRFIPSTVLDNQFINKEYVGVLESLTGWQRDAWLMGSWDCQAGQFFTTWHEPAHVVDFVDEKKAVNYFASFDYGFNHYTVFHLFCQYANGDMYVLHTHRGRQMTVEDHASRIKYMLGLHNLQPRDLSYVAAGKDCFNKHPDGTTVADQYAAWGIDLVPAEIDRINGWAAVLRRLGDPQKGIKPTLYVHKQCKHLIEQFPVMQHDPNKPEDIEKQDITEDGFGGDDDIESLRFGISTNPSSRISFARPAQVSKSAHKWLPQTHGLTLLGG